MNKQTIKHIRELANRLPVVYQECMSGGTVMPDETGNVNFLPHLYNVEVNHERRLRKAYEKFGLDGIKSYLEMITKLQKQRHENFIKEGSGDSGREVNEPNNVDAALEVAGPDKSDSAIVDVPKKSKKTKKGN